MNGFRRVQLQDGGGNVLPKDRISVQRVAAIGDNVAASVVADKLHEQGIPADWQCHPMLIPVMKRVASIASVSAPNPLTDVTLDGCYEKDPERKTRHFHSYFVETANRQLKHRGIDLGPPLNCRPSLRVTESEKDLTQSKLSKYPKPWVMICPRSQWFRCRDVPDYIWEREAPYINGTCFWLGMNEPPKGIVALHCQNIEQVLLFCAVADLMVSPDTGPAHLAIALGTQALLIGQASDPILHFSDLCDYEAIYPPLPCLNCQENRCPINTFTPPCQELAPLVIAAAANRKLNRNIISCVIPTFNAPAERLNRCLEAVLPQVDEIIVTADAGGRFPPGASQHPKIRYVQANKAELGFGRNVNFGVRHTSAEHIWVVNDDFFAQPNVATRLRHIVNNGIGMATHLIRYETSGRIYYASKPRGPAGFYHADHNEFMPSREGTFEVENACGCSFMLNRKAFYAARCFDEEFQKFYCEDDALSMQLRSKGWKLMYTTDVFGNHIGSASTNTLPDKERIMHESNMLFGKKWANRYMEHNRNTPGLGNFAYLE